MDIFAESEGRCYKCPQVLSRAVEGLEAWGDWKNEVTAMRVILSAAKNLAGSNGIPDPSLRSG
jgi:hypothetical protein